MSKEKLAKCEAWVAIAGNLALAAFKFAVAAVTGSAAVSADSWHTLSDSLSSAVLLAGVRLAERPPDREHPFGHGRAELVAALVIGTMLGMLGFEFLARGVARLVHPEVTAYGRLAMAAMAATIVVKEAMAQFAFRVGRATKMVAVEADGHHHRGDALSSLVLLAGIVLGGSYAYTDGILTIVVSGFIFHSAWEVLREAIDKELGREPTPAFLAALSQVCAECLGEGAVPHHVHLHHYAAHHELTLHVNLPGETPLREVHGQVERLEALIHSRLGCDATIHVDPAGIDD